jgi:hypothetical protein
MIAGKPDDSIELTPQSWVVFDGTEDVFGITIGPTIQVRLMPGGLAFFQSGISGGGFVANNNGTFFYNGPPSLGNLIMAITGTTTSGVDQYGNLYTPGGVSIIGQPTASALFTVQDLNVPPNTLASIGSDGSFSTEGLVSAGTDVNIAGQSLTNDILPQFAQGMIAHTTAIGHLPLGPNAGAVSLYELDFQAVGGRTYMVFLEDMQFQMSAVGIRARVNIYCTTDGSVPSNASPMFLQGFIDAEVTAFCTLPFLARLTSPANPLLYRFLVEVSPNSGTLTLVNYAGGTFTAVSGFGVMDLGPIVPDTGRWIGAAGGGGATPQNYVKTYTATASHSYQGSDGGNPNLKINDNSTSYQGGDRGNTYNGKAKTWFQFNLATITADLSGATITKVQLFLNNNHTWYSGGMTAAIGWDNKTSFGSTAIDPAGAGIDVQESNFNEGQSKWVTLPNSVGTAFQNGSATTIVLWRNTNSLQYYGFFAGSGQSSPPQLKISYTK